MKISRRKLLKGAVIAGAGMAIPTLPLKWMMRDALAFYQTPTTIPLFGTRLRGVFPLDPNGIPVAIPDGTKAPVTGVTHYKINIGQYSDTLVPGSSGLGTTKLWGYRPVNALGGTPPQRHLGGIIIGKGRAPGVPGDTAKPIQITFRNNLPAKPIIPVDVSSFFEDAATKGLNRTAVHLHGGLVPWISDGGPFDYWSPTGNHGPSFLNNQVLNPTAALNEAEYYYPLNQSARFAWYHDHAHDITRVNAYAGIASGLLIRDAFEANLINMGLPNYIENGGNEIPLIFQDKIFVGSNIRLVDPAWLNESTATTPGSLWYAHSYERTRWRRLASGLTLPEPSVIPEFFGDTMLVNGTTFPRATVQARRYRLRILNACNARFLNLQLYVANGSPEGITLNAQGNPTNAPALCDPNTPGTGATVLQIGTEGGFQPHPVKIPTNIPFNPVSLTGSLLMGPAERSDIIIDFSHFAAGQSIILYNDAPAPFPFGDPRNDYFPGFNVTGNPINGLTPTGFGPNSRILMRFDIVPPTSADPPLAITTATNLQPGNETLLVPEGVTIPPPGVPVRPLTLNETFDANGRLIQMLGTATLPGPASAGFGRPYLATPTEVVNDGATEVWEIYNLTGDVHPIHFHLVNVQIINRQPFQVVGFSGVPATFTGPPVPPQPNEVGWKETVQMYPGTVTRVIMKFDLSQAQIRTASGSIITTPPSPRTGGAEYVWHCHILEHEEHDMMRPLIVNMNG